MNMSEHIKTIDETVEKERFEKKKREIFDMTPASAEEMYVKSCEEAEE